MSFSKRYAHHESKKQLKETSTKKQAFRLSFSDVSKIQNTTMHWRAIFFSLLIIVCGLVIACVWHFRDQMLFPVKHIDVQGRCDAVQPEILQNIFAKYAAGSMLFLSEQHLTQALEKVPWIDFVVVKRIWPSTISIVLQQKIALARFGPTHLLSEKGVLFVPPDMDQADSLPYIEGPENRVNQLWQAYLLLNNMLLPIHFKISRLEVSPRLSYSIVLNNGLIIYLGSTDIATRLALFVRAYSKLLHARSDQIEYVDMRYNSGMAVGWKAISHDALDAPEALQSNISHVVLKNI